MESLVVLGRRKILTKKPTPVRFEPSPLGHGSRVMLRLERFYSLDHVYFKSLLVINGQVSGEIRAYT